MGVSSHLQHPFQGYCQVNILLPQLRHGEISACSGRSGSLEVPEVVMWMSSLRVVKDLPWFIFPEQSRFQSCSGMETAMSTASQSPGGPS